MSNDRTDYLWQRLIDEIATAATTTAELIALRRLHTETMAAMERTLARRTTERDDARAALLDMTAERDELTKRSAELTTTLISADRAVVRLTTERDDAQAARDRLTGKLQEAKDEARQVDAAIAKGRDDLAAYADASQRRDAAWQAATGVAEPGMVGQGAAIPGQDRAEELCRVYHDSAAGHAARRWLPSWSEYTTDGRVDRVEAMRAALVKVGAPSPAVAPGPVLAGVSPFDLHRVYEQAGFGAAGMLAVVARLGSALVAPVDPEAAAKAMHDRVVAGLDRWTWSEMATDERARIASAMRATLTTHGIPVTPEVGK